MDIREIINLVEAAAVVDTPAFKAWFGASKVVDEQGVPKRMYHGTGSADITSFDPAMSDPDGLYGTGLYFTDSAKVAGSPPEDAKPKLKGYAFLRGLAPSIYPVFLRIVHPVEWDKPLENEVGLILAKAVGISPEVFQEAMQGGGYYEYTNGNLYNAYAYQRGGAGAKTRMNKALMAAGYDGMHHEGGQHRGGFGSHEVWIAFRAEQVKSIFSKAFDPNNAELSEAVGPR